MPSALVYFDEKEDRKIVVFSRKWELSKLDTVKKMVRDFKEGKK